MNKELENKIKEGIRRKIDGVEVEFHKVTKTNSVNFRAVCIHKPGCSISPTIYIDEQLKLLYAGIWSTEELTDYIVSAYRNAETPDFDAQSIFNKDYILKNVEYRLVNQEKNAEMLRKIPHRDFLDLAVVYRAIITGMKPQEASCLVTNNMCEVLGISAEELYDAAERNTSHDKFCVKTMNQILSEISGVAMPETPFPLYILTNNNCNSGACVMLNHQYFDELSAKFGCDLYVLPSSIHEVIVVPVNFGGTPEELRQMVLEVNAAEVSAEEYLSDSVYRYSDGKMAIA